MHVLSFERCLQKQKRTVFGALNIQNKQYVYYNMFECNHPGVINSVYAK